MGHDPSGKVSAQQGQSEQAAARQQTATAGTQRAVERIAGALEAPKPATETDREARDLKAQEAMAKWARFLFVATVVQTVLSVFGLVALIVTIRQGREGIHIGQEQATISRESSERQLRAYIDIRDVVIVDFAAGKIPCAQGVIENAGSTPAHHIRLAHRLIATVDPSSDRVRDLLTNWAKTGASMGPRGITHLSNKATRALTAEEVASFNRGEWGWVVATAVSYRDVFGKLRRTISRGTGVSTGLLPNETVRVRLAHKGVRSN